MENKLKEILDDYTSGSSEVLEKVFNLFLILDQADIESSIEKLEFRFPHFPILIHFLEYIKGIPSGELNLASVIKNYQQLWQERWAETCQNFVEYLLDFRSPVVLLHSNSGMIKKLMLQLHKETDKLKVIQTESRPMNEGVHEAKYFAEHGIDVELILEANIPYGVEHADLVVLGADLIYKDAFVNKVGSKAIAMVAQKIGKPVYVVGDRRKRIEKFSNEFNNPQYPPEDVIQDSGIEFKNYYFEVIPNELVTKFYY